MIEYIEKEAAQNIFAYGKEDWKDYEAAACIAALPAVDVVPTKNGRWERRCVAGSYLVRWRCSVCGRWQTYGASAFCPNCGARMEVKNEVF